MTTRVVTSVPFQAGGGPIQPGDAAGLGTSLNSEAAFSDRVNNFSDSVRGAAASTGLHHVGRNLAEHVSDHVEHLDFFSENSIGACVTCFLSAVIWLVFLPIFHLGAVPWMEHWESEHALTVPEFMLRAQETFPTPHEAFLVLDADGDGNSTQQEFLDGSAVFKRPPFQYPAYMPPIFAEIDSDADGFIQAREFYHASPAGVDTKWHINMTDLKKRAKESYGFLDSYYTAMDINSDGKVDLQEFVTMAADLQPPVPQEDAKALFHAADADGRGFIEPREWVSYNVSHTFTFQAILDEGILPEGPRVNMAVEAGLRQALKVLQYDLLNVDEVKQLTSTGSIRRASTTVNLRISFIIFLGTRSRQEMMIIDVKKLPNDIFRAAFENSIGGGSTTLPVGPPPTKPPAQKAGPLTDAELKAYFNVPAVIQGHTELLLSHASAGVATISTQEEKLKPIFKSSFDAFCKCSITVESVQTESMQDQTGQGGDSNKTMILSWSIDVEHGGTFEKLMQDSGHQLVHGIYEDVMQANMPCMEGVTLDSWTRFTATYYGQAAGGLPRGAAIKQYVGHFRAQSVKQAIRNDTGTPPFVTHP